MSKFNKSNFSVFKNYPAPLLVDDYKLQAILIYIESLLTDTIKEIKKNKYEYKKEIFNINTKKEVIEFNQNLIDKIREVCPTLDMIEDERNLISNKRNFSNLDILTLRQSEPFKEFYNVIVNSSEKHLENKRKWIPDLFSLSLIHNWKTEFENPSISYARIVKINFQPIFDKYNSIALEKAKSIDKDDIELSRTINKMYEVAEKVIEELNKAKYKTFNQIKNNTSKRKSKTRKK